MVFCTEGKPGLFLNKSFKLKICLLEDGRDHQMHDAEDMINSVRSIAKQTLAYLQVAFSSFTDFGPYMALAIAIHNIPEVNCPFIQKYLIGNLIVI